MKEGMNMNTIRICFNCGQLVAICRQLKFNAPDGNQTLARNEA